MSISILEHFRAPKDVTDPCWKPLWARQRSVGHAWGRVLPKNCKKRRWYVNLCFNFCENMIPFLSYFYVVTKVICFETSKNYFSYLSPSPSLISLYHTHTQTHTHTHTIEGPADWKDTMFSVYAFDTGVAFTCLTPTIGFSYLIAFAILSPGLIFSLWRYCFILAGNWFGNKWQSFHSPLFQWTS